MEFVIEPQIRKLVSMIPRAQEQGATEAAHWMLKFVYAEATGPDDGPAAMQRAQKAGTLYKYVVPIKK